MSIYYVKKSLEILRDKGLLELSRRLVRFLNYTLYTYTKKHPRKVRAKSYINQRLNGYSAIADPFKIITVSPDDVKDHSSEFGKWESVGKVASGNWDKEATPVEEMMKFRAVKQRFQKGVDWEDTGIIDYHCRRLAESNRTSVDGCSSRSEYIQWYSEIDGLYKDIKNNGYRHDKHSPTNYIAVHIGRNGELLFAGSGCHRLSICKILDIDGIPVWVRARHEKWQKIRDTVDKNGLPEGYRDQGNHPDLQDVIN